MISIEHVSGGLEVLKVEHVSGHTYRVTTYSKEYGLVVQTVLMLPPEAFVTA